MNSPNNNSQLKFITAHKFLSSRLKSNCGNLEKKDLAKLTKILINYCSFGPVGSKNVFQKTTANFIILDMNVNEYTSKNVGNSQILFDEKLQYGYNININQDDNNTYNKIISNPLYLNRYFFNDLTTPTAVDYCKNLVSNVIPAILTDAGDPPSESKIIVAEEQTYINSVKNDKEIMFTFYNNHQSEKRMLFIMREQNQEQIVKYYEEKEAVLVGEWKKSANPGSGGVSIISKLTCNETYNASATFNLTTDVPGYYDVYVKGVYSNNLYRISNVVCFATDKNGVVLVSIDQTDPGLNQKWVQIVNNLYVETTPSASIIITNSGGEYSTQYVSVDSLKIVSRF